MAGFIRKTFGGLSLSYYLRNLFFGGIMAAFCIGMLRDMPSSYQSLEMYIFIGVLTLLYPYSRFVYDSIMGFIMGDNEFLINAFVYLIFKIAFMFLCFIFSIFIAPIGFLYLYYYHSKNRTFDE